MSILLGLIGSNIRSVHTSKHDKEVGCHEIIRNGFRYFWFSLRVFPIIHIIIPTLI